MFHTAGFVGTWNDRQLIDLFRLPKGLFSLYVLSEVFPGQYHVLSFLTANLFPFLSLIMLMIGIDAHYSMVRRGRRPYALPRPRRREFIALVSDIMRHGEFAKLKDYFHHTNHIYDHVVRVSYISYAIAKALQLDYQAAARGGLLHDFFLYDWRERKATDEKRSLHGKEHPHIALHNARTHFEVNEMEADIIVKHMFPKTMALPRYRESLVVSLADKIATVVEYAIHCTRRFRTVAS